MSGDKDDDVFEYGDQTTFRLRDQEFMVDDLNTIAMVPTPELPPVETENQGAPEARTTPATIEEKLDAVLHAIENLQRRVDSIDAMIARVLTRG